MSSHRRTNTASSENVERGTGTTAETIIQTCSRALPGSMKPGDNSPRQDDPHSSPQHQIGPQVYDDFRAGVPAAHIDLFYRCVQRLRANCPRVLSVSGGECRVMAFLCRYRFNLDTAEMKIVEDFKWRENMGILCPEEEPEPGNRETGRCIEDSANNGDSDGEKGRQSRVSKPSTKKADPATTRAKDALSDAGPVSCDLTPHRNKKVFKFPILELEMLGCPLLIPFGFDHKGRLIVVCRIGLWDCDKLYSLCSDRNMPKPVDMIRRVYAKYLCAIYEYIQRNSPRCTAGGRLPTCVCILDALGCSQKLAIKKSLGTKQRRFRRKSRRAKHRSRKASHYNGESLTGATRDLPMTGTSSDESSESNFNEKMEDRNSRADSDGALTHVGLHRPATISEVASLEGRSLWSTAGEKANDEYNTDNPSASPPPVYYQPHPGSAAKKAKDLRLFRVFEILTTMIGMEEEHFPGLMAMRMVINSSGKFRAGWKSMRKLLKTALWASSESNVYLEEHSSAQSARSTNSGDTDRSSAVPCGEDASFLSSTDSGRKSTHLLPISRLSSNSTEKSDLNNDSAWASRFSTIQLLGKAQSKRTRRLLVDEIGLRCLPAMYGGSCHNNPRPSDLRISCLHMLNLESQTKKNRYAAIKLPSNPSTSNFPVTSPSRAVPLPKLPPEQLSTPRKGSVISSQAGHFVDVRGFDPTVGGSNPLVSNSLFRPAPLLSAPSLVVKAANKMSSITSLSFSQKSYTAVPQITEDAETKASVGCLRKDSKHKGKRTSKLKSRSSLGSKASSQKGNSKERGTSRQKAFKENWKGEDNDNYDISSQDGELEGHADLPDVGGKCMCLLGLRVLCCNCCCRCGCCQSCGSTRNPLLSWLLCLFGHLWHVRTLQRALSALNICVLVFAIILIVAGGFMRSSNFWSGEVSGWGLFVPVVTIVLGTTIFFVALLGFAGAAFTSRLLLKSYGMMLMFFAALLLLLSVSVFVLSDSLDIAIKQSWSLITMQQADAVAKNQHLNTTSGDSLTHSSESLNWATMSQEEFLDLSHRNTIGVGGSAMAAAMFLAGLPLAWTLQLLGHIDETQKARDQSRWGRNKHEERMFRLFGRRRLLRWTLIVSHLITFSVAIASLAYSIYIILISSSETAFNAPYLLLSIGIILLLISGWGLVGVTNLRPSSLALQVVTIGFLVFMLIVFMSLSMADLPQIEAIFNGLSFGSDYAVQDQSGGGSIPGSVHDSNISVANATGSYEDSHQRAVLSKHAMMMKEAVYVVFLILISVMFNLTIAGFLSWALYKVLVSVQKSRVEDYVRRFVQSELFHSERSSLLKPSENADGQAGDLIEKWVQQEIENPSFHDNISSSIHVTSNPPAGKSGWLQRQMHTLEFSAAQDENY